MTPERETAYRAAIAADAAFTAALVKVYGKKAGDARYRYDHSHPDVIAAKNAKVAADHHLWTFSAKVQS